MKREFEFLNLATTNAPYADQLVEAAERVIRSGRFLNGVEVHSLEQEICKFTGAEHAVAVSTGLDAIRLIFRAYIELERLHEGDEVIFPANTFIASVLPVTELGLRGVPAPVDPATGNLDFKRLEQFVTPATRAVLTVHLYGSPSWDKKVFDRLHSQGILIIEDNAQALGAKASEEGFHGSRRCGALGDAAAVSFYPTKNLGALGDAGMVLTSDSDLAKTVRILAQYGSDRRYYNIMRGYNNRMDELQAAMLRTKLPYLDEENARRRKAAAVYCREIKHPDISLPDILPDAEQVWHQFVIRTPRRDELQVFLADNGVATDIHYPVPPHAQECYRDEFSDEDHDGNHRGHLKEAEDLASSILSLPIANISEEDARIISDIINSFPHKQ